MTFNYPKGIKKIEGPKKRKAPTLSTSAANRGMGFEQDINDTNSYYLEKGMALIYKRPTPINVVKVDYTKGAKITHAYYEQQSTTDYNGVYKGRYVDFEAKSSKNKTSFPMGNIAPQQIVHLKRVIEHGGIAFFLINMYAAEETYLLKADFIIDFYEHGDRKSIPLEDIRKNGYLVKEGIRPRFDYLPLLDEIFLK
ncbi:MAG: Holliday junction resolvase RecU [Bacilli bacterium]|nr:Holliday junction resolvase RecU [Bacilli bacterium]